MPISIVPLIFFSALNTFMNKINDMWEGVVLLSRNLVKFDIAFSKCTSKQDIASRKIIVS